MKMSYEPIKRRTILALDPGRRGVGFAVLEVEPLRLVDFGTKVCRASDAVLRLDKALKLVGLYEPDAVVIEDWRRAGTMRREAVRPFAIALEVELLDRGFEFAMYSPSEVRRRFLPLGVTTIAVVARVLAIRFPELLWRVPPIRKIYLPEDDQLGVFDAVALALTHIDEEAARLSARGP